MLGIQMAQPPCADPGPGWGAQSSRAGDGPRRGGHYGAGEGRDAVVAVGHIQRRAEATCRCSMGSHTLINKQ